MCGSASFGKLLSPSFSAGLVTSWGDQKRDWASQVPELPAGRRSGHRQSGGEGRSQGGHDCLKIWAGSAQLPEALFKVAVNELTSQ